MAKEKILNVNLSSEEPDWIEIDVNDSTIINGLDSDFDDNDLVEAILMDDYGNEIPETSYIPFDDELAIGDLIIDESESLTFDTITDVADL